MSSFIDNFNQPGWLAHKLNEIFTYLADGKEGVIPSLRALVLKEFNKYDNWESIFGELIPEKMNIDSEFLKLKANLIKQTLEQMTQRMKYLLEQSFIAFKNKVAKKKTEI